MLIFFNRPRVSRSSNFDITCGITPCIVLHLVQLRLQTVLYYSFLLNLIARSHELKSHVGMKKPCFNTLYLHALNQNHKLVLYRSSYLFVNKLTLIF